MWLSQNTKVLIFREGENSPTPQGEHQHAKFSRKLHEIERIWMPGEGAHAPP